VLPSRVTVTTFSATDIPDLNVAQYPPLGHCMYCGTANGLTREHIVPFGLSGTCVLPRSSCKKCASITGKCEAIVLRGPMRDMRILRRLKSRKQHSGAPATYTLTVERNGRSEEVRVPLDEYPVMLHFPNLAPARALTSTNGHGLVVKGTYSVLFGPHPEDLLRNLGADTLRFSADYDYVAFARMIAKIGYSYAVADGLVDNLKGMPPVIASILGIEDRIGDWVGMEQDSSIKKYPQLLHRFAHRHEDGLLVVDVQLFADSETPTYHVVLGPLDLPPWTLPVGS
jgi:hypothetical protein